MKYVALLRGINVGGNNKVEMKRLKASFEALHFENVSTYINSGNVIFETRKTDPTSLAKTIEKVILKYFKLTIRVVVRDEVNIKKLASKIPEEWTNDSKQKTDVLFLWEKFDSKKSLKLIKVTPEVDNLVYLPGAIIWNLDKANYNQSGMNKFIGTELYKNMTARNVNTVRKLSQLLEKSLNFLLNFFSNKHFQRKYDLACDNLSIDIS